MREAMEAATELTEPIPVADAVAGDYDIIFVPGGWGPMEDLAVDTASGDLLTAFAATGRPPGPGLPRPRRTPGHDRRRWRLALHRVPPHWPGQRGGTRQRPGGSRQVAPAGPDRLISDLHADYSEDAPFEPHVVVDRNLFTGQNPASATPLAQRVVEAVN